MRWDVPSPVDQIKFWSAVRFVTNQNEFYRLDDGSQEWVSLGYWPGDATIEKEPESIPVRPSIAPNPTDESTRILAMSYEQAPYYIFARGCGAGAMSLEPD